MRFTRPLLVSIWKNWILHRRFYIVTAFEITIPILLSALMIYLSIYMREIEERFSYGNNIERKGIKKHNATFYQLWDPVNSLPELNYYLHKTIFFVPNTSGTNELMKKAFGYDNIELIGFDSEEQMILEKEKYSELWGAVIFSDYNKSDSLPLLKYELRPSLYSYAPPGKTYNTEYRSFGYLNDYMLFEHKMYLGIIASIDLSYIQLHQQENKSTNNIELCVQRMPYPPYESIESFANPLNILSIITSCSFLIPCLIIVKRIVDEKNNRAKEMMKMMGMSTTAYWGGVFISNFLLMLIISTIITILYVIPFKPETSVLQDNSFVIFFITLLLYCVSSVLFCCVMSTLFTKAAVAITLSTIIWIGTELVGYLSFNVFKLSFIGKVFICLLPNTALTLAGNIMTINDSSGDATGWNNIMKPAFGNPDSFCLGIVLGMMILSCLLYTLLLLYLDTVWPWQPGVPKSPLFFFYPSYWFHSKSDEGGDNSIESLKESEYFEEEPLDLSPSIVISHLSKVFNVANVSKLAVNDLSLNMYPGQITALLGHNGAGKTTTMNILTGIFPPTKGTASINGHDIVTNTNAARSSLGLCPQHNVLYDGLTVEEHLKMFAALKGMPWSSMNQEIPKLIKDLGLQDKKDTLSKNLSGGMKRKLSLGNAIAGEPQILILDEPTTGLDPEARRVIWDVLERLRSGRTILLTTHYMEEADALGDRIAIMASGTVQCCGSAMFLKRKFGAGYHLRIEKTKNCYVNDITKLVLLYIPEAKLLHDYGLELIYSLSNATEKFSVLFQDLENSFHQLGIASCGVTITTMDDVFLKVGQMTNEQSGTNGEEHVLMEDNLNEETTFTSNTWNAELTLCDTSNPKLTLFQQMEALFKKKMHYAKRHLSLLIFQILLPMIAVIVYIYLDFTPTKKEKVEINKFNLDLDMFRETKYGFYHLANNSEETKSLASYYISILEKSAEVKNISDPQIFLAKIGTGIKNRETYVREYLLGGSIAHKNDILSVTAWYNGIHYHLDAISINLMTTALLKYTSGSDDADIHVTVKPFSYKRQEYDRMETNADDIYSIAFLPLGFTFISSSFVLFPIHERVTKAKLLQRMCGVSGVMYWLMHLSWDFLIHLSSSLLLLIPFLVDRGIHGFVASEAVGAIFFCLLLYGLSAITLSYLVSFIPKMPSSGFAILTIFNALTGIIITFIMSIVATFGPLPPKTKTALWFMRLFPNFTVSWGIKKIITLLNINAKCISYPVDDLFSKCNSTYSRDLTNCCTDEVLERQKYHPLSYLSWENGAGKECLCLFLTFVLWLCIVISMETYLPKLLYTIVHNIKCNKGKQIVKEVMPLATTAQNVDSDVSNEHQRVEDLINRNMIKEAALVVNRLTKHFGSLCAVNNLTFAVHKEECFGLLGINGAGKTTTFQMLTGDLFPTNGSAFIDCFSIVNNLKQFQMSLGYCPQFDALIDRLTCREILQLFANLRRIPKTEVNDHVNQMISMCDLSDYADKQTRTYSGGTKRKLSLAIALIGAPPIVLLDEPTAGVDPASRRKIWKTLSSMKQMFGVSFILTSHSMDECESLCNRIAIMVNGEFHCLGAMQSLKAKFGQGYSIIAKLQQADSQDIDKVFEVKTFIEQSFPGASLKVEHQGALHYHITDTSLKWSRMFLIMEEAKQRFQLEDYILGGTTLEQIFLTFARSQKGL